MMKGIQTLEEFCRRKDIADFKEWIDRATEELKTEGLNASHALAKLIKELIDCRSPNLLYVLIAFPCDLHRALAQPSDDCSYEM